MRQDNVEIVFHIGGAAILLSLTMWLVVVVMGAV